MQRKFFLALAALGVFSLIAAGSAQAGWGHSHKSTQPGETMSSEESAPPQESVIRSENPGEEMKSSEYQREEALETGELPESERSESKVIFGDDVERQLREGFLTGGP